MARIVKMQQSSATAHGEVCDDTQQLSSATAHGEVRDDTQQLSSAQHCSVQLNSAEFKLISSNDLDQGRQLIHSKVREGTQEVQDPVLESTGSHPAGLSFIIKVG